MVSIFDFYEDNKDFREYVDKYCKHHGITKETAFTHLIVIETFKYYLEISKTRV